MSNGTWQQTGPVLTLRIPAHFLLEEDICDAAHWAQHAQEEARRVQQAADDARNQPSLW